MAPRANKILHDDQTRAKIQASQIINRFMGCVNGDIEMSPAQVSAGKALLNKVLPDLQAISLDTKGGLTVTIAKDAADL